MNFWSFIAEVLERDQRVALLYVLESKGSSPGRQGFRMAVDIHGNMAGSIGGGIMEHKLVEKAKSMLATEVESVFFKRQIHNKTAAKDQSGMICSGEQTVAIYRLDSNFNKELDFLFQSLKKEVDLDLLLGPEAIKFILSKKALQPIFYEYKSKIKWEYRERLGFKNVIHIIGGGHVGLALARQMHLLNFYIKQYDDRHGLNTMEGNPYANEKIVVAYDQIGSLIPSHSQHYVVIMTFGYRSDKEVLKQLLGREFRFLGMMGSAAKIKQLYREYGAEGIESNRLEGVNAPIGMPISSKTPEEIAVSIAAQIIAIKNKEKGKS